MIVSGTVTKKMAPQVVRLFNQMPEPKYVIAMGACAICGGPFRDGYNVLQGIDLYLPVDVYIPGCPPRPEALLEGLIACRKRSRASASPGRSARATWKPTRPANFPSRNSARMTLWGRACPKPGHLMQTLEQIKDRITAAFPGAQSGDHSQRQSGQPAFPAPRSRARAGDRQISCATIRNCASTTPPTSPAWTGRKKRQRESQSQEDY